MATAKTHSKIKPYRVLSLDGGGMRGIYTAAFLDRLTTHFALPKSNETADLGRSFDLITGTSTGAIVACALAIGKPMNDVVALYKEHGRKIFPHRIKGKMSAIYRAFRGGSIVRAGDIALRDALVNVLGDATMSSVFTERGISLSIPTVLMSNHRSWVFKKTPASGNRDDNYPLVDVCMASSAAPVYRSLAAIEDPNRVDRPKQVFADGGLWANNPILVGLIDALLIAKAEQPIELFSLGTCGRPEGELLEPSEVDRSMLGWQLGASVAPLSISAQEFAFDNMARLLANQFSNLGRSVKRVRFPSKSAPAAMLKYLSLDDARPIAMNHLIQQASDDADLTKSACDDPTNEDGKLIRSLMECVPTKTP